MDLLGAEPLKAVRAEAGSDLEPRTHLSGVVGKLQELKPAFEGKSAKRPQSTAAATAVVTRSASSPFSQLLELRPESAPLPGLRRQADGWGSETHIAPCRGLLIIGKARLQSLLVCWSRSEVQSKRDALGYTLSARERAALAALNEVVVARCFKICPWGNRWPGDMLPVWLKTII